jgi:hypothetical protein
MHLRNRLQDQNRGFTRGPGIKSVLFDELINRFMANMDATTPETRWQLLLYDMATEIN